MAARLLRQQALVGVAEQALAVLRVDRRGRPRERDTDVDPLRHGGGLDLRGQRLYQPVDAGLLRARRDHRELVAADARQAVAPADGALRRVATVRSTMSPVG